MRRSIALLAAAAFLGVAPLRAPDVRAADRKSDDDKKAVAALKRADALIYRPLSEGLKDVRLEFEVDTTKGRLRALWLYRVGDEDAPRRERMAVTNERFRTTQRSLAAGLKEYFILIKEPVLLEPFAADAETMTATWKDARGGMTVLTAPEGRKTRWDEITYVWNSDGLPREITWTRKMHDEEEGDYKIDLTATIDWKRSGKHWVIGQLNTNRAGSTVIARFDYGRVGGILLPSRLIKISPFLGEEEIPLQNVKVNEGIPDEEFRRW